MSLPELNKETVLFSDWQINLKKLAPKHVFLVNIHAAVQKKKLCHLKDLLQSVEFQPLP